MPKKNYTKDYWAKIVGRNVRVYRKAMDMTQAELHQALEDVGYHVDITTVSRLDAGSTYTDGNFIAFPVERLVALADALGVSVSDLIKE